MEISGYYNKGKLLKEGCYYSFKYVKCVTLEDNNQYMIFEDQYGIRHFLEHESYKAYNLIVSSDITCLVAKINCTGRIYLEPQHPMYIIGNHYPFMITSAIGSSEGVQLTVKDCFNNLINIHIDSKIQDIPVGGKTILAKVVSIKKGIPELITKPEFEDISK